MRTREENFYAIRKCVLNDYPYPIEWEDREVQDIFNSTYDCVLEQHSHINERYYSDGVNGMINLNYMDHYVVLAFRYAHALYANSLYSYAEAVYYSLRMRCGIDLFYTSNIDSFFMPVHAIGTILDSHSKYGKLFQVYNNVHIGPYNIVGIPPQDWGHPLIGNYVTVLGGSHIYGETHIGNNVIISANTTIINEEIPDNCIVSGKSPDLFFQRLKIPNNSLLK